MTQRISLTALAHSIIKDHLSSGDTAIDATIGNGHDTLFLVKQVGSKGKVFGFDIQQQAIDSTQTRLYAEHTSNNTQLFLNNHHKLEQIIPKDFHGKIKVIMFNLGYLPGGNKSIITQTESTVTALKQSVNLLSKQGMITITAYPGHPGGEIEMQAIDHWLKQIASDQYSIETIYSSDKNTAPRLYIINSATDAIEPRKNS